LKIDKEQKYKCLVGKTNVEGKTHKEFTLNYLKALVEEYKELPPKQRFKAYIEYFVDNFSYDKETRDVKLKDIDTTPTKQKNEEELFNLFYSKKGVCQQFSQGIALLYYLDIDLYDVINVYESDFTIRLNNKEMGHATNLVSLDNKVYILDISSMIHCKEKDYAGDIWDYGMVLIEDYIEKQKQNKCEIIPNTKDRKKTKLICYKNDYDTVDEYYDALNLDRASIMKDFKHYNFLVDITGFFKELSV